RGRPRLVVAQAAYVQPRAPARLLDQVLEQIDSRTVAPMQILEEHDAGNAGREVGQGRGDPSDELLPADSLGLDRLACPRCAGGRRKELLDHRTEAGGKGVAMGELAQHLDKRMERDTARLVAATGDVANAGELKPVLQFAEEP